LKPWTTLEIEALRYLGPRIGGREAAAALGRSHKSVKCQASRLGVTLSRRENGEADLRLTPEAVTARVRQLALAPICPACGFRYVTVARTGMCAPCHVERRIALHEQQIDEIDAQRDLWAARSKLQRRRRAIIQVGGS
jgi:hypothetical protein